MATSLAGFWVPAFWSLEGLVLLGLVGLVTIAAYFVSAKAFDSKLPPGPTPLPIIGNLHQLGPKNPHHILWDMSKKHGPIMRLWLGSHPLVVVSSAQAAAEFVKVQDKIWAGRPPSIAGEIMSYNYRNVVWASYGNYWRHVRKICSLELFTPKRLESFRVPRAEELSEMIKIIFQETEKGEVVNLEVKLGHLSSNNITRMLMNKRFFDVNAVGEKESHIFKELIFEVFSISLTLLIGDFIPWLKWVTTASGYKAYIKRAKGKVDVFLQSFLDFKKAQQFNPSSMQQNTQQSADSNDGKLSGIPEDFVDVLMAQPSEDGTGHLAEDSVKAVIQDLLLAGTDTSSLTVEWGVAELLRNPEVMKKLQDELDTVVGKDRIVVEADLPNLPYLQAVTKEVFRLHPTTPIGIPHESMEATTLLGYKFPNKTRLFLNLYAIHRDPATWERPLEFDPERFIKNPEIDVRGKHLQLMPFGTGRRMCPGMPLAIIFVQMGLARLAQSFDFTLPGGEDPLKLDMSETFGLSTPRVYPLCVVPKLRLAKHLYL